jgi:uncharacterized membrane protein YdjX (TVP38/TMEM64 family)
MTRLRIFKILLFVCTIALLFLIKQVYAPNQSLAFIIFQHIQELKAYSHQHYVFAVCIYILLFFCLAALSIPGASLMSVLGGVVFNIYGIPFALLGATTGATLLFVVSRYLIGKKIQVRFADKLRPFNQKMEIYGKYYLFIMRLCALLPFGLVTMLAGLTLVPIKDFVSMTCLGITPMCVVYGYIGSQCADCTSLDDLYSFKLFGAGASVLLFKLIVFPFMIKLAHIFVERKKN